MWTQEKKSAKWTHQKKSAKQVKPGMADLGWVITALGFVCLTWSVWGQPGPKALALFGVGFLGIISGIAMLGKGKLEPSLDIASAIFAFLGLPLSAIGLFGFLALRFGMTFISERLVNFVFGGGIILLVMRLLLAVAKQARQKK